MTQLAARVIDAALRGELTDHLGIRRGRRRRAGRAIIATARPRRPFSATVRSVAVNTPRDRQGSFEPQLVAKRQARLAGLDKKILGLYAGGMSVCDIVSHLTELYSVQIGRD